MLVFIYSIIMRYSFGFKDAHSNAHKIVKVLKLCSEQCSYQKHYDYGMRTINSILMAASSLRENSVMIGTNQKLFLSLYDVNFAKFNTQDIPLFVVITGDLFLGVRLVKSNPELLISAIKKCCEDGIKTSLSCNSKLIPSPVSALLILVSTIFIP